MVIAMSVTIIELLVAEKERERENVSQLVQCESDELISLGNCVYIAWHLKRFKLQ